MDQTLHNKPTYLVTIIPQRFPTRTPIRQSYGWNSLTKCSNKFGIVSSLSNEDRKVTPAFVGLLLL